MKRMLLIFVLAVVCGGAARAAEVMPPPPTDYFNDYANVVSPDTAERLNQELQQFDHDTTTQIVVAIYPTMQSDSSVDDYAVRIFNTWKVGGKKYNNGAVLFVFMQQHKMFIQTGYGLEGALPDALCKQIIDEQITPRFKQGDYAGGLSAGVDAILAATKGEYKGRDTSADRLIITVVSVLGAALFILIFVWGWLYSKRQAAKQGARHYSSSGHSSSRGWTWSVGGGDSSSGGGGFSAGGGMSGGGGAGGSW
jgi:uncharacterized protein